MTDVIKDVNGNVFNGKWQCIPFMENGIDDLIV